MTTYEVHLESDGLFAIPIVNGEPQNGMLIEGVTKEDIQEEYETNDIDSNDYRWYFLAHMSEARLCNDLGEVIE